MSNTSPSKSPGRKRGWSNVAEQNDDTQSALYDPGYYVTIDGKLYELNADRTVAVLVEDDVPPKGTAAAPNGSATVLAAAAAAANAAAPPPDVAATVAAAETAVDQTQTSQPSKRRRTNEYNTSDFVRTDPDRPPDDDEYFRESQIDPFDLNGVDYNTDDSESSDEDSSSGPSTAPLSGMSTEPQGLPSIEHDSSEPQGPNGSGIVAFSPLSSDLLSNEQSTGVCFDAATVPGAYQCYKWFLSPTSRANGMKPVTPKQCRKFGRNVRETVGLVLAKRLALELAARPTHCAEDRLIIGSLL